MSDRRRWSLPVLVACAVLCGFVAPRAGAERVHRPGAQPRSTPPAIKPASAASTTRPTGGPRVRIPPPTTAVRGAVSPGRTSGPARDGGACTVIPSVPGGLTASNVTSSSVTLSWSASTAGPTCTIQYRIFQNGTEVTSVTGTSVTISSLAANTTFRFSVASIDQAGTSAQSGQISVTTLPLGGTRSCSSSSIAASPAGPPTSPARETSTPPTS